MNCQDPFLIWTPPVNEYFDLEGEFNRVIERKAWIGETTIMSFPVWATNYKLGVEVPSLPIAP
jgi:hypothetical protein